MNAINHEVLVFIPIILVISTFTQIPKPVSRKLVEYSWNYDSVIMKISAR
jgi:hypothetical protein